MMSMYTTIQKCGVYNLSLFSLPKLYIFDQKHGRTVYCELFKLKKSVFFILFIFNVFDNVMYSSKFSAVITPVFSGTWSFRTHVPFDQLNATLLNKSINFLFEKNNNFWVVM